MEIKERTDELLRKQAELGRRAQEAVEKFRDFQFRIQRLLTLKIEGLADPFVSQLLTAHRQIYDRIIHLSFDQNEIPPEWRERFVSLRLAERTEALGRPRPPKARRTSQVEWQQCR
jgi:hypothetical protein